MQLAADLYIAKVVDLVGALVLSYMQGKLGDSLRVALKRTQEYRKQASLYVGHPVKLG